VRADKHLRSINYKQELKNVVHSTRTLNVKKRKKRKIFRSVHWKSGKEGEGSYLKNLKRNTGDK
jgi:hypothetical protein